MRTRSLRLAVATALAVMTGAAGVAANVHAAQPAPCGGNTELAGAGWTAIRVPQLSTVAQVVGVSYAPDRLYATDGRSTLVRSDDDGCHWTDISPHPPTLGGLGVDSEATEITGIAAPSSSTVQSYLYVAVNVRPTDTLPVSLPAQPIVYASASAGIPFTSSTNGLPTIGTITQIASPGTAPKSVYAVITAAGSNSGVYYSGDGASTWERRGSETDLTQLQVNPAVPNQLFAISSNGAVVSDDGGQSFHTVGGVAGGVSSISVAPGAGAVQIAAGHAGGHDFDVSLNAGNSWLHLTGPAPSKHVAIGSVLPLVTVSNNTQFVLETVHHGKAVAQEMTPALGPPIDVQLSAPTPKGLSIYGIDPTHRVVVRATYDPFAGRLVKATLGSVALLHGVTVKQFPSTLTSGTRTVLVPAGGHQDVSYQLLMPRTPSPVDVMFLVDTTISEDATIAGVRDALATVVNDLGASGLDVRFGLADFKDYPFFWGGNGDDTDYPYKLRGRIGTSAATLQRILAGLKAQGGNDIPEASLTALYQSTTGAGQKYGGHYIIRPGMEAGYRAGSLRLAVIATDAPYHKERDYPTPPWSRVVSALDAAGVHQVGLAVQKTVTNSDNQEVPVPGEFDSFHDESRMARDTGALAPTGGADCDGNGTTDVPTGAPLVCKIVQQAGVAIPVGGVASVPSRSIVLRKPPPLHLAPVISELAAALPDYRAVTLQVKGAPAGDARVVSNPAAPRVNVRVDQNLGFVVRYSCPAHGKAHSWPLTVTATAGPRALTSIPTTLVCGPAAARRLSVAPLAPAVVAAVVPPGPPNPPTNVNANANPNPALNPNAGFATQDEEQPQVALADAEQGPATDEALAMSRRSSNSDAEWMLGAAAVMTAAAAGYATRTRWRTATARAWR